MNVRSLIGVQRRTLLVAVSVFVFGVVGCGPGASNRQVSGQVINVTERDFSITTAPRTVSAGTVLVRVHNDGPDAHELIVVRAPRGRLPLRSDGLTVDEEALARSTVGSLVPGGSGASRRLEVRLTRGRYLLFCNMAGHFMGGMHAELVVR